MPLAPGTRVGAFEIVSRIGAGGMGEVYRARDTRLKREVAFKVLHDAVAGNPERMARFRREGEVLATLNHPHIAAIYGLEENGIVMELVEGETLSRSLAMATVLRYARQIAEALEYAHQRGVMHRDLKPDNIKVTADGNVKLLDFGLAKVAEKPDAAAANRADSGTVTLGGTRQGTILGTPAYMSPEQAAGEPSDFRADIWSFGAVLFELLSGKRAFAGDSVADTLGSVLKLDPDWTALPAATPASIRTLLRRCLTKDATQRLQAIGEARIAIDRAIAGGAEEEPAPIAATRLRFVPWALAGVLAVVAAAGWWMAKRSAPGDANPLVRLSVDLGPDARIGGHITAAISPDGNRIAFPARGPEGKTLLATRLLDQEQAMLIPGTEGADDPFFSFDGQQIGFFAEGKMKKVSVRDSTVVTICAASSARGAAWGEDGNIIVTLTGASGTGLSRVTAAGGTPQSLTRPEEKGDATHRWPQLLPGGKAVLFMANKAISNYDDSNIEVLSLATGQTKIVVRGGYFGRYLPNGFLVYVHQRTLFGVRFDPDRMEVSGAPTPLLKDLAADSNTAGGQFDFSRNGRFLYLTGKSASATWTLSWIDSTGKQQPLLATPGIYYEPRLSPDGKRLAFSSGTDIEVYDVERGTRARLTFATQAVNNSPVWTRDGQHIVFVSESARKSSLQWMRADGAGEARTLRESKNKMAPYSFSPDGKRLAFFEQNEGEGLDLWTLPLDLRDPEHPSAGAPEALIRSKFAKDTPAISPDGRWLAYSSTESGRLEVYVQPFPPAGAAASGKWLVSTAGGGLPIWSRDGHQLLYESQDRHIMAASYTVKGNSFEVDKPRLWTNAQIFLDNDQHWNMDAAPDGKRFVVASQAESDAGLKPSVHVTFLLNFFDEVRRRIPTGR